MITDSVSRCLTIPLQEGKHSRELEINLSTFEKRTGEMTEYAWGHWGRKHEITTFDNMCGCILELGN